MTEEQTYDVVKEYPDFELRWYPEHVVAETRVEGSFATVGNTSFRRLVGYISGRNADSQKVAMTAPVLQEAEDEKAASYVVRFVMPTGLDLQHAPEPTDGDVQLRTIPAQTAAALRFSGRWTQGRYEERANRLQAALKQPASKSTDPFASHASTHHGCPGSSDETRLSCPSFPPLLDSACTGRGNDYSGSIHLRCGGGATGSDRRRTRWRALRGCAAGPRYLDGPAVDCHL